MSYLQFGKAWEPQAPSLWIEFWIGTQLGYSGHPVRGQHWAVFWSWRPSNMKFWVHWHY
jgi:hypothetical protein